jgi:hypothetical protein
MPQPALHLALAINQDAVSLPNKHRLEIVAISQRKVRPREGILEGRWPFIMRQLFSD